MMDQNSKLAEPLPAREVMMEAMVVSALESAKAAEHYGLRNGSDHPLCQSQWSSRPHRRLYQSRCPLRLRPASRPDGSRHGRQGPHRFNCRSRAAAAGRHRRHHPRQPTPKPGGDRTEEVLAAQQILQSLSIRSFMPQVTSCPGCGRTTSTYFQELAEQIQGYLRTSMPEWRKRYPGVEELKLAVMGCVVNGPGESKHANLGISLPGTFEEPKAPVYVDGKLYTTLRGDTIVAEFKQILDKYVESRYGQGAKSEELVVAH